MSLRALLLLTTGIVAGLFWSLGSDLHAVVMHFIAPPTFAIAIAALWRQSMARQQFVLLIISLGAAELVRAVIYCVRADGWRYITYDGETQLVLAVSFGVQLLVGVAAWGVARIFFRRREAQTA